MVFWDASWVLTRNNVWAFVYLGFVKVLLVHNTVPGLRAVIAPLATMTTAAPTCGASGCSLPAASQAMEA